MTQPNIDIEGALVAERLGLELAEQRARFIVDDTGRVVGS